MFEYEPLKKVKRSVIVDTDIGPDVDDVGALVVLRKVAQKYDVPVLRIVNCTSNIYGNDAIAAEQGTRYRMEQVCSVETINAVFDEFLKKAALDWREI